MSLVAYPGDLNEAGVVKTARNDPPLCHIESTCRLFRVNGSMYRERVLFRQRQLQWALHALKQKLGASRPQSPKTEHFNTLKKTVQRRQSGAERLHTLRARRR